MNESDLQTGGIGFDTLVEQIRQIDEQARRDTARAVNIGLTLRNWSIGFYIDHYELKGADRSKYGDELYHRLAEGLHTLGVKSCDRRQLYRYRDFFQTYPQIVGALSPQFAALMPPAPESATETAPPQKVGSVTPQLSIPSDRLLNSLSYTHLEQLVAIEDSLKRAFYEVECVRGGWSVRELKRQIGSLYAWYNSWEGHGSLPDYSRLRSQLRSLVDAEQFDAVIELGRELIELGMQQVEQSHDEGETAGEIMSTLSIVAEAITPCSLTDIDRILFVIDSFLQDDYDLCHSFSPVLTRKYAESAWADVAEKLKLRLPAQTANKQNRATADFTCSYQRERLSGWIIEALEAAGDKDAATDFCIEEAAKAGSYQRAVDRLVALKRYDEAKELASQGLENTDPTYAGLINRLQDSLATIASKSKDHSVAAAIAAERFVARPSLSTLQDLLNAAKKAKCEAATKTVAMNFLETGKRPVFTEAKTRTSRKKKATNPRTDHWPFPAPPGANDSNSRPDRGQARKPIPHFDVLIRLSIKRRNPESVLRWYDQWQASTTQNRFRINRFETEVADAVSSTHPDRAVELY